MGEERICICRGDMVMRNISTAGVSATCALIQDVRKEEGVFMQRWWFIRLKMSSFRSSFDMLRYDYGLVNYLLLSNLEIGQCR